MRLLDQIKSLTANIAEVSKKSRPEEEDSSVSQEQPNPPAHPVYSPQDIFDALAAAEGVSKPVDIDDLLNHDGAAFIQAGYLLFLERAADPEGLMAHLALLDTGCSKVHVAYQLARSDEAHARHTSALPVARQVFERKLAEAGIENAQDPALHQLLHFAREQLIWSISPAEEAISPEVFSLQSTILPPVTVNWRTGNDLQPIYREPTIWIDLTTSLEWTGGVIGIVRAELEVAAGIYKLHPGVRFSMNIGSGFVEIDLDQLSWLLDAENVVDAYMKFFGRYKDGEIQGQTVYVNAHAETDFFHPYIDGDIVYSMGWMDSSKEKYFSRLKYENSSVYICYLIYDLILLLPQTKHYYDRIGSAKFYNYVKWTSYNCDFLLFGGETAKNDVTAFQASERWPVLSGTAVKFGTDIMKSVDSGAEQELLKAVGVTGPFMLTVGTIEPRKNHDTLYRAYLLALEIDPANLPQLIVCGKPMGRVGNLIDSLDRDPRLKGKLIHLAPTDAELAALYKNCLFTILPSVYEGWSLTLPESLGQGKFCLACDTPPLREIGGDLIDYFPPFDVRAWAEGMLAYGADPEAVRAREQKIQNGWPDTTWLDTSEMVLSALRTHIDSGPARPARNPDEGVEPTIWMDLTLTYLQFSGSVSGIPRAELTYAYYFKRLAPSTRFFAYEAGHGGYFFEIDEGLLEWLFNATDLNFAYKGFHDYWLPKEAAGEAWRNPFGIYPPNVHDQRYIGEFPSNAVIFFTGIDIDGTGAIKRSAKVTEMIRPERNIITSQLIYDFTPVLCPQLHLEQTCVGYWPFIKQVSNRFDHIVYGGRTSRKDGEAIQAAEGWRSPPSDSIEFGGDLALTEVQTNGSRSDRDVLDEMGVVENYVLTVGTVEPRKNQETLYKAYLDILSREALEKPLQLVIVGKAGWKSEDFLQTLSIDDRVRGKILVLNPSDSQLDSLYRNCLFTLLPSFYEGWSLTLPESFRYGKFCLVSDVEPLRETGRDLAEYIHPLDTYRWAQRIEYYANHPDEVAKREARIRKEWHIKTWEESARDLRALLLRAHKERFNPAEPDGVVTASPARRKKVS